MTRFKSKLLDVCSFHSHGSLFNNKNNNYRKRNKDYVSYYGEHVDLCVLLNISLQCGIFFYQFEYLLINTNNLLNLCCYFSGTMADNVSSFFSGAACKLSSKIK